MGLHKIHLLCEPGGIILRAGNFTAEKLRLKYTWISHRPYNTKITLKIKSTKFLIVTQQSTSQNEEDTCSFPWQIEFCSPYSTYNAATDVTPQGLKSPVLSVRTSVCDDKARQRLHTVHHMLYSRRRGRTTKLNYLVEWVALLIRVPEVRVQISKRRQAIQTEVSDGFT
jgi:hypothetical protein